MLSEHDVQALVAYQPQAQVLSVFLNTDTRSDNTEAYKLRLRTMISGFEEEAPEDVRAVLEHVEHAYDRTGKSIAIFSCQQDNFFKAFSLSLTLRERARRLPRPYVKPIADLLDQYGHYGIALISQQDIRLLVYHLGAIEKDEHISGEAVRRYKIGRGSQASGRRGGETGSTRTQDATADRNVKKLAAHAARFFRENGIRRVLLGGTEENIARLMDQLPRRWRSLVAASFPIDVTASHAEIRRRSREAGKIAQRDHEQKLIDHIITSAAKGQEGVIRLDDTLGAVRDGSVQTLVIKEGYRAPGYLCPGCEYLTAQHLTACPFCGESFAEIEDAVEMAVRQVLIKGGDVTVIHTSEALEKAGSIGALLRY